MGSKNGTNWIAAPSTGEMIAEVAQDSVEELRDAVAAARRAQEEWKDVPYGTRARAALRARRFVVENVDRIAEIVSRCTGKTRVDALSTEVLPAAIAIAYYTRTVRRELVPRRARRSSLLFFNKRTVVQRVPFGVVGIIAPWNYPFGIPIHEVMTALLAGNGVVLKVATVSQPVGELIAEMIRFADFPSGLFRHVRVPGGIAGKAFLDAGIDKLFFTGSTEVGKLLMQEAGKTLTPVSLELGGNDAMVVLSDANLPRAAAGAVWAGVSNCGQSCGGVQRIYVESAVYGQFRELLSKRVSILRQGPDLDFNVDYGSITTPEQLHIVDRHLKEARSRGARIVATSSGAEKASGLFFPATLVEVDDDELSLIRDESFGPLLALCRVRDEEEAIRKANASYLGLTASVWSMNRGRAAGVASRLQAGTVTINDHLMTHGMAEASWGGVKQSGIGRTHGVAGIHEMTQERCIVTELLPAMKRNMWWHPHSRAVYDGLKATLDLLFGHHLLRRARSAFAVARLFLRAARGRE